MPGLKSDYMTPWFFLLEGKKKVIYDGKNYIVKEGDCSYFDSNMPHYSRNIGNNEAKFLVVFCSGPGRLFFWLSFFTFIIKEKLKSAGNICSEFINSAQHGPREGPIPAVRSDSLHPKPARFPGTNQLTTYDYKVVRNES